MTMTSSPLQTPDYFETSRGYHIKIRPVSSVLIADVSATVEMPPTPTYQAELAGGSIQILDHDETTLSNEAERAAWALYKQQTKAAERQQFAKVTKLLIMQGLELPEPSEQWLNDMREMGITIPSDPYEFRKFFLDREVLSSISEFYELIFAVMQRSQDVPQEAIAAIQAAFKSGLEEVKSLITQATTKRLELLRPAGSGSDGKGLGSDTLAIQRATDA